MRDLKKEFVKMLEAEVKPAVGCTEPVALALACAKCKEILGEEVIENKMFVSPSIYKNGMCVGIPGTDRLGLKIAAAIGIVAGKSEKGLSVLEGTSKENIKKAEELMDEGKLSITPADTTEKVFVDVEFKGEHNTAKVVIKTKHDNFVYLEKNGEVLLDAEVEESNETGKTAKKSVMDDATLEEIIRNVEAIDYEDIKFLKDGVNMNLSMAKEGLSRKIGIGAGFGIKQLSLIHI